MAQNRPPPAYQEYSAAMLANVHFREMPMYARGLLYTLRLECWENHRLPADPLRLAGVLRLDTESVIQAMAHLDSFFETKEGWLFSPELEDYRNHLQENKEKKSQGGKKGAAITNTLKNRVTRVSLDESSSDKINPDQISHVIKKDDKGDGWDEYLSEQ